MPLGGDACWRRHRDDPAPLLSPAVGLADGYSQAMSDSSTLGLNDLFGLIGGGLTRTIGQFQRGVTDLLRSVENFNRSMEELHAIATRVNGLLDTVEEPVRMAIPQLTRTIQVADRLVSQIADPIEKVAPGIDRLADTLASPVLTTLPNELASFMATIGDVATRLAPLAQIAEQAGGLFGLRGLLGPRTTPAPPAPTPADAARTTPSETATTAEPKAAARKNAPARKPAAKKAPARQPATKKSAATAATRSSAARSTRRSPASK